MTALNFTYPVIGVDVVKDGSVPPYQNVLALTSDKEFQDRATGLGEHPGMVLVDAAGRSWSVSITGVAPDPLDRGFWGVIMKLLGARPTPRIQHELVEGPPVSFEGLRALICTAIDANPEDWREDEAIAGEDGPAQDEQMLLERRKARVRATSSPEELISLLSLDPPF